MTKIDALANKSEGLVEGVAKCLKGVLILILVGSGIFLTGWIMQYMSTLGGSFQAYIGRFYLAGMTIALFIVPRQKNYWRFVRYGRSERERER